MPTFLIERECPGAGQLRPDELAAIARRARAAAAAVGPGVEWLRSYVTDDRIVCSYVAADEEVLREHAMLADLPAGRIIRVGSVIDPATAESPVTRTPSNERALCW